MKCVNCNREILNGEIRDGFGYCDDDDEDCD